MATKYLVPSGADNVSSFSTVSAWAASLPSVLTEPEHLEVADGVYTDSSDVIDFGSHTTSAANYMRIYTTLANRHDGRPRSVSGKGAVLQRVFWPGIAHIRLEGLELNQPSASLRAVNITGEYPAGNDIRIESCLIHDQNPSTGFTTILISSPTANVILRNNIVYNNDSTIDTRNAGSVLIENCTLFSLSAGACFNGHASTTVFNTYCGQVATTGTVWAGTMTGSNNASSDVSATARFTNSYNSITPASVFNTIGATLADPYDFNLKAGTNALLDVGSVRTGASVDARGRTRPQGAAYDIGALERVVQSAPDAPTNIVATAGAAKVTVSFTAPANDGGSAITSYTATWSGGQTATGPSSPLEITGVTSGVAGTATVRATNANGTSAASVASNSVTPTAPVTPPTATVTEVLVDGQNVTVNLTTTNVPTSGTISITAQGGGAVTQTKAATLGDGTATASFTDVVPGDYSQTATFTNAGGTGSASGTQPFTIIAIGGTPTAGESSTATATAPSAPINVVATAGEGTVTVNGSVANDGGSPILSYKITASTGQVATDDELPITIAMPNGIAVTFTMTATNAIGESSSSAPSNQVIPAANVVVPSAPLNPVAVAGPESISVSYNAPSNNGGASIIEYIGTLSTGETASSPSLIMLFSGISPGTARTATIRARNSAGTGPASAASNSVTPLQGVPQVTGISVLPQNATLDGGGTIQLVAIVNGINSPSQNVTWTRDFGTVSQTGLYTAPEATVIDQTVTVTATSDQDPSFSASVTITIKAIPATGGGGGITTPLRHYDGNITNNFGVAIEGASVTVTNSDTGEKAILYEDKNKAKQIFNPIVTDDNGYFEFYVEAVQCSYSVRGPGIKSYVRNDIFDIINNVDLTPITTALQNLQTSKVSATQLSDAVTPLAKKVELDQLGVNLETVSLAQAQQRNELDTSIQTTEQLVQDVEVLKETLPNLSANPQVDVNKFVTGGTGTAADPWTGWDTAITWSANTQYDFQDGVYRYINSPNFARNFLSLKGRNNTVLVHTGNGVALNVDAGAASANVVVGLDIKLRVESNAGSAGGAYLRGVAQSKIDLEFNNVPGTLVQEVSCYMNNARYVSSAVQRIRTVLPASLLSTNRRGTDIGCAGNTYQLVAEGCTGTALNLEHCLSSEIHAVLQGNNVGMNVTSTCQQLLFTNLYATANAVNDVVDAGTGNTYTNAMVGGTANFNGQSTLVRGGRFDTIHARGKNSHFDSLAFGINGGLFNLAAVGVTRRNLLNSVTGQYENDIVNPVQSLSVAGKTTLSSDSFIVGDGQIFKNPAGQLCLGTSQPTGLARFTLHNPNNTATDINFQSNLESFSTTAYHYKANSGGGTDVFLIAGNGNTTNLNNSYAAISDERLKENITDASPKLLDLMNVRIVNYNLIEGDGEKLLGVLAGELEAVFPGLISVDENGIKSVKYSVFVPMIIKALQEMRAEYMNQ